MNGQTRRGKPILLLACVGALLLGVAGAQAGVRAVSGGIEFSYYAPGAGKVYLAGSFNGWNASQLALTDDGKGNWTLVHQLGPGKHEYKFVVDGAWFADPDNPNTSPDPYGGTNSLVEVGGDGKIVEGAESRPVSNTTLNAKLYLSGRYLSRYNYEKNGYFFTRVPTDDPIVYETVEGDEPRFRLQRPIQSVDLNFHATINEIVDSYTRLRLDNRENLIQDNIAGFLDEASITVHPSQFRVTGYWDMEVFQLDDPYNLGGDIDLPGTIMDDHLLAGKGTTGGLFSADPLGIHLQTYFANVHDYDIYNDPELFDNTGKDLIGLRASRKLGGFEFGLPAYLERELIWMDFGGVVSQTDTGIPQLNDYLDRTGDSSTWFEFENRFFRYGLDVTRPFWNDRAVVSLEWLYGDVHQGLVTGNDSGPNQDNGAIDVPFLTRALNIWHGSADLDLNDETHLNVEHTFSHMSGSQADETELLIGFKPEFEANRQIYFLIGGSPEEVDTQYSEATLSWDKEDRHHALWLQRTAVEWDFGAIDQVTPWDPAADRVTSTLWVISGQQRLGKPDSRWGRWELENALTWHDYDTDKLPYYWRTLEFILRCERQFARRLSFIADIRYIHYDVSQLQVDEDEQFTGLEFDEGFWAPYGGVRYLPNAKVEVVVAYGVDPLDFGIDYQGRHLGRWWTRQEYLYDHPNQSIVEAERYLDKLHVIGARAMFRF